MASLEGFNAAEVEPNKAFEPLPAGNYTAVIINSEEKATSAGTGSYIKLEIEVIDGPHKGRKLFDNLNLNNPSAQAVTIAKGTLSAICRAVGVLTPKDSSDLHNIPLVVKVGVERRQDTGGLQNRIKGYEAKGGGTPAAEPAQPGTAKSNPPPWLKK